MLEKIRAYAGIQPGADGLYGLEAGMSVAQTRESLQQERFVEFAFEQKRYWDLRRWRLADDVLDGLKRTGRVATEITEGSQAFTYEIVDIDEAGPIVFTENMYFFPIHRGELLNNPNVVQTKGWEDGAFDPLQ